MKSVGEKLRGERIKSGIDLATLSQLTRISEQYLESIESGTTGDPPTGFFYRSFVRQYATALGLPSPEIESELERVSHAGKPVLTAAVRTSGFRVGLSNGTGAQVHRAHLGTTTRTLVYLALLLAVLAGLFSLFRIVK